ncbi:hypothetical protein RB195_005377 [Necator americanus]|uniref:Uncharacterized protein n=1 Tax=Necator americanus TaxID=51031 RepID=A0ABR1BRE6_NECAM
MALLKLPAWQLGIWVEPSYSASAFTNTDQGESRCPLHNQLSITTTTTSTRQGLPTRAVNRLSTTMDANDDLSTLTLDPPLADEERTTTMDAVTEDSDSEGNVGIGTL